MDVERGRIMALFFFSSRRRHTRCSRDWSSDVCSSDLPSDIARLCEKLPEADVNVVTDALGLDTRIGPKYLKGAVSYGGPCFPRHNSALAALAAPGGGSSRLAEATDLL